MSRFDFSTRYASKSEHPFVLAAARAFYVDWWLNVDPDASGEGRNSRRIGSGCEILDIAPQTQRWAIKLARQFAADIATRYGTSLEHILEQWQAYAETADHADREATIENLGFYAAMQAMGHGVSLWDCGVELGAPGLPRVEAYPR